MEQKSGYSSLMHEVCVGLGWCGSVVDGEPLHVDFFIPESGPVSAEQFVVWLFQAEGMDAGEEPEKWRPHIVGLREAFIWHMGSDIVDAQRLKWDVS